MSKCQMPVLLAVTFAASIIGIQSTASIAQTETAAVSVNAVEEVPEPLSAEEMEVLVARIALYPDELVAVITAASLYPLQIVEAQRFLDENKTKKDLKPKATWDGSVVSLLNYPEVVKMMSDDLDWTQLLGEAIVNQQKEFLDAIQQLREKAVAEGIIKTDDKVKVVKDQESDSIVIQPTSTEVIYVPQYPPEMLYEEDYIYQPVSYYPDPYPYYYYPGAPFFAGVITGAFWGAIIDWDDGVWGGDWDWGDGWNGGDIDIDCNKCIIGGDFNGKLDINNIDWKNIDRSKINFDRSQLGKIDKTKLKNNIRNNDRNKITNKAKDLKGNRASAMPGKGTRPTKDVRTSTLEGLKKQPGPKPSDKMARPGQGAGNKAAQGAGSKRPQGGKIDRPTGKPRPAAKKDTRPKNPSPVGNMKKGKSAKKDSNRGAKSMGGGYKRPSGGGGGQKMKKRPMPHGGGGRRGGGGGRGRR